MIKLDKYNRLPPIPGLHHENFTIYHDTACVIPSLFQIWLLTIIFNDLKNKVEWLDFYSTLQYDNFEPCIKSGSLSGNVGCFF
jgi:hypothetical protein